MLRKLDDKPQLVGVVLEQEQKTPLSNLGQVLLLTSEAAQRT